jgi:predicted HD phosphohydrolase
MHRAQTWTWITAYAKIWRMSSSDGPAPSSKGTSFTTLEEATPSDWRAIMRAEGDDRRMRTTGNRLLDLLASMRNAEPLGSPVNLYEHSLQTASRVVRAGEDDELVVMALFHDLPEALSDNNHGLLAAELLSPWISKRRSWMLIHHVDFQQFHFLNHPAAQLHARDRFIDHPFFAETAFFCARYDQNSFDANYPSLSLADFRPVVQRFFARPRPEFEPLHGPI